MSTKIDKWFFYLAGWFFIIAPVIVIVVHANRPPSNDLDISGIFVFIGTLISWVISVPLFLLGLYLGRKQTQVVNLQETKVGGSDNYKSGTIRLIIGLLFMAIAAVLLSHSGKGQSGYALLTIFILGPIGFVLIISSIINLIVMGFKK